MQNVYILKQKFHETILISHTVHIVYSSLLCFAFLKILIRPTKVILETTKGDATVWKNMTLGQRQRLRAICHLGITQEAKQTSPPTQQCNFFGQHNCQMELQFSKPAAGPISVQAIFSLLIFCYMIIAWQFFINEPLFGGSTYYFFFIQYPSFFPFRENK